MITPPKIGFCALIALVVATAPASAVLVSLSGSGTISSNSTLDPTIPVGTAWAFELIYDTNSADQDILFPPFTPNPTFGRYTNEGATPALTFFHYQAGAYEVTLDEPGDFDLSSNIIITFAGTHAIDINIDAPSFFPPLAGNTVRFHADYNDFSPSIFTSDALPTDTSLNLSSFNESTVSLLIPSKSVTSSQSSMTSFKIAIVPEPSVFALAGLALLAVTILRHGRRRQG